MPQSPKPIFPDTTIQEIKIVKVNWDQVPEGVHPQIKTEFYFLLNGAPPNDPEPKGHRNSLAFRKITQAGERLTGGQPVMRQFQ